MADPFPRAIYERPIMPRLAGDTTSRNDYDLASSSSVLKARLHTPQEWQAMYAVIRQLYLVDNRKLSEVMLILDHHYGFKAT